MPIYEYQCPACGHQFEMVQKMTEEPLSDCPECQHHPIQKLVSAAGFQLKGTGWYATDFRDKSKAKKSDTKPEGEVAKSTESKPTDDAGTKT